MINFYVNHSVIINGFSCRLVDRHMKIKIDWVCAGYQLPAQIFNISSPNQHICLRIIHIATENISYHLF